VSPIAETRLEHGLGMCSLPHFAWSVVPIPSYQHPARQPGHAIAWPHKYSLVVRSNGRKRAGGIGEGASLGMSAGAVG